MSRVIKINVSTGRANGDYNEEMELPDNWDDLNEDDQAKFLNDVGMDFLHECCEVSSWVQSDD